MLRILRWANGFQLWGETIETVFVYSFEIYLLKSDFVRNLVRIFPYDTEVSLGRILLEVLHTPPPTRWIERRWGHFLFFYFNNSKDNILRSPLHILSHYIFLEKIENNKLVFVVGQKNITITIFTNKLTIEIYREK